MSATDHSDENARIVKIQMNQRVIIFQNDCKIVFFIQKYNH
jgi:hypothetical protein